MTDLFSARVMKENIERLRPCFDPDFSAYVRQVVNNCSSGRSFTSNHAANHVGMGFFMFFTLRAVIGRWSWLLLAWGFLVAFAQVYVGLHYPFDVLGGAIIGFSFASLMAWFFHKKFGFITFEQQPTS
jgi:undecaprenyl-diphosphatase